MLLTAIRVTGPGLKQHLLIFDLRGEALEEIIYGNLQILKYM
jgi:hypothetical protein